ncbi:hypothetical protein M408DRAFT_29196 [Serendipita vermifera MAFF 305830]|uniref:Uncharacterized protein n=1 Tax=Serendipita vermifera MAFF 305830 TaxID=933852 RepID=A0A0C2WWY6_SERVB|nr:hypothetical protein M408DRAFT_29196 [Serendipita vermifera MAFF 305830]
MSEEATGSLDKAASLLEKDLDTLKGLLHPIRRAPDDVLRLIFEHSVQNEIDRAKGKQQWVAVWLSHVCSRWRSVAVSTPRIWSHMSFTIRSSGSFSNEPLKTFLHRAASVPISLILKFQFTNHDVASLLHAYELFVPSFLQSSRFSLLEIKIDTGSSYSYLDRFPPFPFAEIDSLTLSATTYQQEGVGMAHLISKFKHVRELFIRSTSFGPLNVPIEDSIASSLEDLEVTCVREFPLLEFLTQLPNLRYFVASDCTVIEPTTDAFNNSVLPSLEILDFHGTSFPWANVQCPRLTGLVLDMKEVQESEANDLWQFLERTQTISGVTFVGGSSAQLSQLVRKTPQIKILQIANVVDGTVIRDAIVDESILPNLDRLTFLQLLHQEHLPISAVNTAIRLRRMRRKLLGEENKPVFGYLKTIAVGIEVQDMSLFNERSKEYLERFFYLSENVKVPSILFYHVIGDEEIPYMEM